MRAPDPLPPALSADLAAMDAAVAGRPLDGGDPDLAALALGVRELRRVPDQAAARRLDRRVATALATPATRRPARWRAALLPALGVAACAMLVLVAVLASRGGEPSGSSAGGSRAASGSASSGAGGSVAPQTAPGRAVERSTVLRLGAPAREVDSVASAAARVATGLGGYVASSSVTGRDGATLDLRVPGARLDQAVQRLSQLGRVRDLERSTLDITDQLAAARTRVADARAERRSLLRRLAAATTERAAGRIRDRLQTVTRRLERARGSVRRLRARADLATIGVTVVAERRGAAGGGAGGGGPWTPGDALHDAARILEVAAGVLLVVLAVLVPLVLVGAPAWLASRWWIRQRRERALGPA